LKSVYVDSCRYLLPAAALANVGMTANARVLEHLISKMLSHPLSEVRQIGEEIKRVSQVEVPTLVKYANHTPYLEFTQQPGMGNRRINPNPDWCSLVDFSVDGELRFLASLLYRDGCGTYADALEHAKTLNRTEQEQLVARYLATMQRFDYPLRESEHIFYTFDVSMDQGAYYEVKRHRMMTQTPQGLTCSQGYVVPKLMADAEFVNDYNQAMQAAADGFSRLADIVPAAAAYLVPNGFKRRVLLTMNFREAFTFVQLRSSPGAHFGVRLVAQRMAEQIKAVHPVLGSYLRANPQETWQSILNENFHSW
jgi:thymidylate synthase ThyX